MFELSCQQIKKQTDKMVVQTVPLPKVAQVTISLIHTQWQLLQRNNKRRGDSISLEMFRKPTTNRYYFDMTARTFLANNEASFFSSSEGTYTGKNYTRTEHTALLHL